MCGYRRRDLLRGGLTAAVVGLGGCQDAAPPPATATATSTATSRPEDTPTATAREQATHATETPGDILHVDAQRGTPDGPGTETSPFDGIQAALTRAQPGQTVAVAAGTYRLRSPLTTVRAGTKDGPITLTGPPEAVVRPATDIDRIPSLLRIKHDHIHLRGLTLTGLGDPTRPETLAQYKVKAVVRVMPPTDTAAYLQDIVVTPARVGHSYWGTINHKRANHVEIGGFEVIGPAGAGYVLTDAPNKHAGELVYLGTPPGAVLQNVVPAWGLDQSHDIHVHHIDNAAGHPHSELVNTKLGTHDITVEYCTDGGGSQNTEPYPPASIHFQGHDATVRWCVLRNGEGHGVHVNAGSAGALEQLDDAPLDPETVGTGHRIHGNEIGGFAADAIAYTDTTADEQAAVCRNVIDDGMSEATPETCPAGIPNGDGIGHRGGTS